MTKKVTLDKTEYDQMEKEIERLKNVNEELVKGASVVLDPEINLYFQSSNYGTLISLRDKLLDIQKDLDFKGIRTTRESLPNSETLEGLYKILEGQLIQGVSEYCKKEIEFVEKKKRDFETVRRRSLETQEKQKEILFKDHQEALDKLEIIKKGYESLPKNRYIAMGVFIGAILTYLIM